MACLAYALEVLAGGDLVAYDDEAPEGEAQAVGGCGGQFAAAGEDAADCVGDEDGCEGGEDGDEGGYRGAGAEGAAHSLHVACSVVVADDGLHAL